jgi:RNA polymerase sigma-70 factor (ECF subfamily)
MNEGRTVVPNPDARRFALLIEPHLDALFRAAYRLARNRADAEDLVQEMCVRAFERIAEPRDPQLVKPWLLRVMHNLFIDGVRRARIVSLASSGNDEEAASSAVHQSPEESLNAAQGEEQLHRAWLKLDRNHRALLALRAEGYSVQEISEITGVDGEALNARLYRARRSLARQLAAEHETAPRIRMEVAK